MKSLAEILNSDKLNAITTAWTVIVLSVGLVVAVMVGALWLWLVLLILAILMISPQTFRWCLKWIALRRLEAATPYYERGDSYTVKGEYGLALVEYSTAIGIDRDNARAYCARGHVYTLRKEYDLAIADFNTAINITPYLRGHAFRDRMGRDAGKYDLALAHYSRGRAYGVKEKYDLAIAEYNTSIGIGRSLRCQSYPSWPFYQFTLSTMEILGGPRHPLWLAAAYRDRGLAYEARGEYDLAVDDFRTAVHLDPRDAEYFNNRGLRYMLKGKYDLAIAIYDAIVGIDPGNALAYTSRGEAYEAKGEYDLAIADYTTAIGIDPNDTSTYISRSSAYEAKGEHELAAADFEDASRLSSRGPD